MVLNGNKRYVTRKYRVLEGLLHRDLEQLFEINTELGKWLRSKNSVEIINKYFFLHGGLSPKLAGLKLSLDTINTTIRKNLARQKPWKNEPLEKKLIGREGPLWYRGYFESSDEYEMASAEDVFAILSFYKVKKIITGHTITGGIQ